MILNQKYISKFILGLYILTFVFALSSSILPETSQGATISGWGTAYVPDGTPTDIRQAIINVTNWILGFVSMVCVLVVLYGLVSGADTIKYGLLGLVICGLAYAIVIVVSTVIL
ncbi:hypothetical protein K0B03_00145 [Patescibacteria group bacterium]|nr:hypothetical protein [Patescibacteria group bacterium]